MVTEQDLIKEQSMSKITPTVGRVVLFTPAESDDIATIGRSPLAAIITNVWSDTCVNLAVFDANGNSHSRTSVYLVGDDTPRPDCGFCEWMPYQKGQAAKTEALEAKLEAAQAVRAPVQDHEIPNHAPRVTPADVESVIDGEMYFTAAEAATSDGASGIPSLWDWDEKFRLLQSLTFCVLVLKNGFTVTGESACASPENFNAEIGRRIARQHAVDKIWPLLGYELRTKLSGG